MSADLARIAIVQWTNDQGVDEEAALPLDGHPDYDLRDWARAFKVQHPDWAATPPGCSDVSVYIELDLD